MKRLRKLVLGLLFGLGAGAVVALLFAPNSGEKMRQEARDYYEQLLAEARQAAEDRRKELQAELAQAAAKPEAAG